MSCVTKKSSIGADKKVTCKSGWMWQKKTDERINNVLSAMSVITGRDCARDIRSLSVKQIPQERSDKLCHFDPNTSGLSRIYMEGEKKPDVPAKHSSF